MSALLFNPRDPTFVANPYPHYRRLREADPVHLSPVGAWFLGRYEDARQILRDPRFQVRDIPSQIDRKSRILKKTQLSADQPGSLDALALNSRHWLSFIEPPNHTRIRRLVQQAFHQRAVESLRSSISRSALELAQRLATLDSFDIMADYARLLPAAVIATLLGVPAADLPHLVMLTAQIARIFDPLMSLSDYGQIDQAAAQFRSYLDALVASRRESPQADLVSALISAGDEAASLSHDELISTCTLLFAAGSETTVNLIANAMLVLLGEPEKMAFLRDHPALLPAAVEEFLRYDAPLQMTSRCAIEDIEMGGKVLPKGAQVYAIIGSANRDPLAFDNPDELDFCRARNPHLAFAVGHHLCLGAMLARLEAQEALRALLEVLPRLELVDNPVQWREHLVLRGVKQLAVRRAVR